MPTKRGTTRAGQPTSASPVAEPPKPTPAEQPAAESAKAPSRNPLLPVGVSLYPLDSESQGPEDWYERDVAEDLDVMADARFALVRVFVSWRVLEPQVGQYDEEALARLASIIASVRERRMLAIVCFFADDRHAELSDVTWGKRRDQRTDGYLVQREVALVQKVAGALRHDQGVMAWQLGNEAFLTGFESAEALATWTETLREAIREVDADRPIGLGCDPETLYRARGIDARDIIAGCEFSVSHVTSAYRAYAAEGPLTSGPATYLDSFLLRNAHRDRPVLMDEVGVQSLEYSAGEEAAHMRMALWSGLMNRAGGVMARRLRDMETERREPYFLDPFETLVGIAENDGTAKSTLAEMRRFVKIAARIDLRNMNLLAERTAVVMPAERFEPLPSLAGLYDPRACLQSFVVAKQTHVPVTVIRETDPFDELMVLIVPSAFRLLDETWERLASFVQSGGTLLLSYGGGDAHAAMRDLFGIEFLGDAGPRQEFTCRVAQDEVLGALRSFDVRFPVPNHALLSPGTATVVATDAQGSPLLTVNQIGQGRAVYVAIPLERAIAQGDPWAVPEPVAHLARELYGAVARAAGCGAPVRCSVPEVEVALLQGESEDVLVLLNHRPQKTSAELVMERRVASIKDVRGGAAVAVGGLVFEVSLEPNGATALRLSYG